jgi:hypothetical protein
MKSKYVIIAVGILVLVGIGAFILINNFSKEDTGKQVCPHECCIDGTYKIKECPANYECRENVCVKYEIKETVATGRFDVPFFGVGEDFNKENDIASLSSEEWKELGVGIARTGGKPFIWENIEPEKGEFDFTLTDNAVSEAFDSGISILSTLWPYALWDQGNKEECKVTESIGEFPAYRCKPQDMEAYKSFLKELVERYDGDDDFGSYAIEDSLKNKIKQNPVIYWEIDNEVDLPADGEGARFFVGSLEDYFDLLKSSYEAIKEVCGECQVLIAAPAGTESIKYYYPQMISLGAEDYFDIYNLHGDIRVLEEIIGSIDKPVFLTEAGGGQGADFARIAVTLAADGFSSAMLGMVPDLEKYNAKKINENPEKEEEFFKEYLVNKEGGKTQQYYALQTLVSELEYFKKAESFYVKEGVAGFKFYFADKSPVYVFFIGEPVRAAYDLALKQGKEEVTLTLDFEKFLVKDLYSSEEMKTGSFTLEKDNVYFVEEISST